MAIPNNYIDKITKDGDSRPICPPAEHVRVENDNFEGESLDEVLDEISESLGEAGKGSVNAVKVGSTPYTPDGEGVVDLSTPFGGKVDKVTGKGLSTNDYTTAEKTKLQNLPTATELTTQLGQKANDNAVVKSVSVNGTAQTKDQNGNVNINVQGGLTKEDISVETQGDGTVDINVKDDTYTINLNHTHENMAKLVITDDEPSNPAMDTIYALVDDADEPTEIQSLWIAGLEFVGGGGGGTDDSPRLIAPRDGLTLDFEGQSVVNVLVKGKNLTAALSLTVTGDFSITLNGSAVSNISAADANNGVTLTLTKGSGFDAHGGSIAFASTNNEVESRNIVVKDSQMSLLPAGYTEVVAVYANSNSSIINTQIGYANTSWRIRAKAAMNSAPEIIICADSSSAARYTGVTSNNKWGAPQMEFNDIDASVETEMIVAFTEGGISVAIGSETVSRSGYGGVTSSSKITIFGALTGTSYRFTGALYEVECVHGGNMHLLPAKRSSDNTVGLYDIENDVFYTGFSETN